MPHKLDDEIEPLETSPPLPSLIGESDLARVHAILHGMLHADKPVRETAEATWAEHSNVQGALLVLTIYVCKPWAVKTEDTPSSTGDATSDTSFPLRLRPEPSVSKGDPEYTLYEASIRRRQVGAILLRQTVQRRWHSVLTDEADNIKDELLRCYVALPKLIQSCVLDTISMIAQFHGNAACWPTLLPTIRYDLMQCYEHHDELGILATLDLVFSLSKVDDWPPSRLCVDARGKTVPSRICEDILAVEHGMQDTLVHMAKGMKQFNFNIQRPESTLPPRCRRKCLEAFRSALIRAAAGGISGSPMAGSGGYVLSPAKKNGNGVASDRELFLKTNVISRFGSWVEIFDEIMLEISQHPTDLECIKSGLSVLHCYKAVLAESVASQFASSDLKLTTRFACVIEQIIQILKEYYVYFKNMVINELDFTGRIEEDTEGGPNAFLMYFAEFASLLVARKRYKLSVIQPKLVDILCILALFAQIVEAQKAEWQVDPEKFIQSESKMDGFETSIRVAVESFVDRALRHLKSVAARSMIEASAQIIQLAEKQKASEEWWKLLEVALWIIGIVMQKSRYLRLLDDQLIRNILVTLGGVLTSDTHELLRARALSTASHMKDYLEVHHQKDIPEMLRLSVAGLSDQHSTPMRVSACSAIIAFLPRASADIRGPLVLNTTLVPSLAGLINSRCEAIHHLGMDTLTVVVRSCPEVLVSLTRQIASLVIQCWPECRTNPLTHKRFLALLGAVCSHNSTLRRDVTSQFLPHLVTSLAHTSPVQCPQEQIVCIDVVNVILRHSETPIVDDLWLLVHELLHMDDELDDPNLVLAVCELLGWTIKKARRYIDSQTLYRIANILRTCLTRPDTPDSSLQDLPYVIRAFISSFGSELQPSDVQSLLGLTCARAVETKRSSLQSALLVTVAHAIRSDIHNYTVLLDETQLQLGEGHFSAFASFVTLVCACFIQLGTEPSHPNERAILYTACVKLLQTEHRRLCAVPTSQDVPLLLLRFLVFGFGQAIERNKHLAKNQTSSESSADEDSDQVSPFHHHSDHDSDEEESNKHHSEQEVDLQDFLLVALRDSLPPVLPDVFQRLDPVIAGRLETQIASCDSKIIALD